MERSLPEHFGKWNSIYKAFNYWSKKGIWKKLFSGLTTDSDLEWVVLAVPAASSFFDPLLDTFFEFVIGHSLDSWKE